jgi:hemerythrin superfamily protein
MDAITLLKDDHRSVEKLFKRFEESGDRAFVEKRTVVDRIIEELSVHAAIEEQFFYPVTRATVPAVEQVARESLEEHHIVKWVLSELDGMDPHDERFEAKVTVLIENVRHHVQEEEDEYFPAVRDELGRKALAELGDALAAAKETAPTRPHPRSPDTPPGNLAAAGAAAVVDRVGATVSGLAQGGVAAAHDVVDRVRGRPRRGPTPTGPKQARRTAASVRTASDDALERVIAAVNAAKSGAERAAGARSSRSSASSGSGG